MGKVIQWSTIIKQCNRTLHKNKGIMKKFLTLFLLAFSMSAIGQTYSKDLEKSAKKGNGTDQKDLGICYLKGYGVDVNYKKAYKWLSEASRLGYADGLYYLATMYEQDIVPSKFSDINNAWTLYERSAELGYKDALKKMIKKSRQSSDLQNLMKWLKKDAEIGCVTSQFELGKIYLERKDEYNAEQWLRTAADNGHAEAQYLVGNLYYQSELGRLKDYRKAKKYLQMAIAQKYTKAEPVYSAIVYQEQQDSIARVRLAKIEQTRRDSIARVREIELAAERRQDSIDIATGRKMPSFQYLVKDVTLYELDKDVDNAWQAHGNGSHAVSDAMGATIRSLCKSGSKSSQKYAALIRINAGFKWSEITYQQNSFKFSNIYSNSSSLKQPFKDYFVLLGDILFPIKQGISTHTDTDLRWREIIPIESSDLLSEIRINEQNICLLLIFKPSFWRKEVLSYMEGYDTDLYFVDPVGLYLVNPSQNKVLLNLSHYTRRANISEKQKFTNYFKAESQRKQRRGNQNGIVTRQRCSNCMGTGVYVWPSGNRVTCWACDGRGYIEYRY